MGGWTAKGLAYTSKYGLMAESDYPAAGKQGQCLFNESMVAVKNAGMVQERYLSNERMKELVNKQPISAGIVVTDAFKSYKTGILTEEFLACSDETKVINHAVTIVGYGKTDGKTVASTWCTDYWIVQNSWGSSWGEQGFFKLCMDGAGKRKTPFGTCQVNRFPSYPVLN